MRPPRLSPVVLLTGALLVLLPALALLQYRWVGQVSDAERERMQTHLRNAALQFHEAVDGEVGRAFATLQVGAATARDGSSERYTDRYDAWLATAAHPQVVAAVFLVDEASDATPPALRVRRWNTVTHVLEPIDWPPVLERWRADFEAARSAFTGNAGGRPFDRMLPGSDDDSLIVAPLRPAPPAPGERPDSIRPTFGFTVLQLDVDYIRTQLMPELAQRYFSLADTTNGYRISVINSTSKSVLYRSDDEAPVDAAHADTVEPLLLRRGILFINRTQGPPGDPRRLFFNVIRRGGPAPDDLPGGVGGPGGPGGPGATAAPGGAGGAAAAGFADAGRWTLLARHQSGSLEAAVGAARQRNLAISFGILLLLGASAIAITVSSQRARTLARQQMEFVASISHELRTPIAVIRSASENLALGVVATPDRVKRYGSTIDTEARRLGDMVERVMQYAGLEAGRPIAVTAPVDAAGIVDDAVRATAPLAAAAGVQVVVDVADELPTVLGDATALSSAVQNLIANAVKYGGADRWVGIRVTAHDGRRRDVRIAVEDHGAGIPRKELSRLFEPFYRGADATARQVHGNGLGLSIVRRIIAAHEGDVQVDTREGHGSTFTIRIPAASAAALRAGSAGTDSPNTLATSAPSGTSTSSARS